MCFIGGERITGDNALFTGGITKKNQTSAITGTRDLWTAENRECFVNDIVYRIQISSYYHYSFFQKLIVFKVNKYEIFE